MSPNVCLIFDLSNITARAYHSVATGKDGQSVVGLARHRLKSMLTTVIRDAEPLRLIAALDCGPSFRHRLYPEYKAHRGEKPDELKTLMAEAPEIMRAMGAELLKAPDFEADDVIATVCDANLEANWRSCVVSNDRDLLQLAFDAGGKAGTYILHHNAGSYHALGPREVETLPKIGVPPHRVALLKAVQGDVSDNLPGVKGLGEVAAKRLASQHASMSQIFKNLDKLQTSDRTKLEAAGHEYALLMERLTTLVFDAPLQAV